MTRQKNGVWKLTDSEMNYFVIYAMRAADMYDLEGYKALSKAACEKGREISNTLKNVGYYANCGV